MNYSEEWQMQICEGGMIVRFENDANFETNECELSEVFQNVLNIFCVFRYDPVYMPPRI